MKAIVIGSTGMVGKQLIIQLLKSNDYTEVVSLVRRQSKVIHPKLKEHVINFDLPDTWSHLVSGDVLYSCLGTTIKQAKTQDSQFKVDFTYQYVVARIAAENGVSKYVLVSSAGAHERSPIFYSRMKGKLDASILSLPFEVISILRPGQLYGDRDVNRPADKISVFIMFLLNKLHILRKYKPINASEVASAMINAAKKEKTAIYTLNELFGLF